MNILILTQMYSRYTRHTRTKSLKLYVHCHYSIIESCLLNYTYKVIEIPVALFDYGIKLLYNLISEQYVNKQTGIC